MEISEFLVNPKEVGFRGMKIVYNADAITPDFLRKLGRALNDAYRPLYEALPDREFESEESNDSPENREEALERLDRSVGRYESRADLLEANRRVYAAMLAGTPDYPVLMEWELTRAGVPIPITEQELLNIKNPQIVIDLWNTIRDAADPKSPEIQTTLTSPTISANTDARSSSQETRTASDPIM